MSDNAQVSGSLFSPAFEFVHATATEVHGRAAQICLDMAEKGLPEGIRGKKVVHVGAGSGLELGMSFSRGAGDIVGLNRTEEEVRFAYVMAGVIDHSLVIDRILTGERTVGPLYKNQGAVRLFDARYLAERIGRNQLLNLAYCYPRILGSAERFRRRLPIRPCDVRKDDILSACKVRGEEKPAPADVLVGNFALHWITKGGSLDVALDKLAPAVRPGGVAVFSIPYHLFGVDDPETDEVLRRGCVYDTESYNVFRNFLLERLPDQQMPKETHFRKMEPMLIGESEARCGSSKFRLIRAYREFLAPTIVDITAVLAGIGTYEAVLRTGKHSREVAPYVFQALQDTCGKVPVKTLARERAGTHVHFFAYQRCE